MDVNEQERLSNSIIGHTLKQRNISFIAVLHFTVTAYTLIFNHIGGVMVRVLAWSAVDRGFESRSCQTKE